ncbi:unnamed protein product [Macrosiphum euphorbiae]|uniref:MADF domain-containing protein n=1 Tax=Macrosiphum euphorbiae TaxID=13131 RepID=A0AAV0WRT9_9HEMI|nr:unnamed protein product [Macrosiphum euphorbiae]CAI6368716.1 unnamed protein product [Macrosiphum euphorbiae]
MEWSNEMSLEFLKLYEQEPSIWNPKNPDHKNRNLVNDAWVRINNTLSFSSTIQELKKKKDSLMASFRPLLSKVKSSMKTGSGVDDVYKPNWFAFETMAKFLVSVYQPRPTISTQVSFIIISYYYYIHKHVQALVQTQTYITTPV